jgi:YT521-B-like domain
MASPINEDPAAAIESALRAYPVEDAEFVKVISTPATQFAPRGHIIDDLALGTIFWEVERDGEDEDDETSSNKSSQDLGSLVSKTVGKPFKIEWLSTTRLPFYRARGLRNLWNSNREVKIARDGTELETAIGRRLIHLFHQFSSPVAQPVSQIHGQIRSTNRNQT